MIRRLISNNTELILLCAWTVKFHSEDIKLFDPFLFTRRSWFDALLKGKNYIQLKSMDLLEGMNVADVQTYANRYSNEVRAEALIEQRNAYMERAKREDSQRWLEKATEMQAIIDNKDVAPNVTGLKEIFLKEYRERMNEQNAHYGKGLQYLDRATKGVHRGELTTIGARPRTGKSALALQIAYQVAMQDFKVIYLPLEMSIPQMSERLLKFTGTVSAEEFDKGGDYVIEQMGLFLDRVEMDGNFIFCKTDDMALIKEKVKEERPYLLVVDQLSQLRADETYNSNRERVMSCTRNLKRLALDENIAVILMSQINRESQGRTEPTLEDLSESDTIGQDSDNVFLLYANESDLPKRMRPTNLKIAKQRNGISGQVIPLMYEGEKFTFHACEVKR